MSTGEIKAPVSEELKDRVLFTFVTGALKHPESISRDLFRALGLATNAENTKITDEQRELVKERLASIAIDLETILPTRVVRNIRTESKQPEPIEAQ